MDHQFIAEQNLVDRYLLGRLTAAERTRFEDHFVDCPRCLEDLELARDFKASLRAGVVGVVSRRLLELGPLAWLARPAGRTLLLGAFLVLVAVPAAWLAIGRGDRSTSSLPPQVNIPTYTLRALRSDEARIPSSSASGWLSLVLRVDQATFAGYRLSVRDAAQEVVWLETGVKPDHRGSLAVTFAPGALPPGDYRLELAGLEPGGSATPLSSHVFRLIE